MLLNRENLVSQVEEVSASFLGIILDIFVCDTLFMTKDSNIEIINWIYPQLQPLLNLRELRDVLLL